MDCRRCSTLFDFSEVTEDVSFAKLVKFPKVVFFRSTRFFWSSRTFASHRRWLTYLSNQSDFQILTSWTMFDLMLHFRRYSEHALTVHESDFRKSGVQQCSIFAGGYLWRISRITEDALFVELGGFPKINFLDTAQVPEFVGWPKMINNVPFFSEIIQDVDP